MRVVQSAFDKNGKEVTLCKFSKDYLSFKPKYAKWTFDKVIMDIEALVVKNKKESDFKDFLLLNFNEIITASPEGLESLIIKVNEDFEDLLYDVPKSKQTSFGKEIEKAFGYDTFRNTTKALWFANSLRIKTCLYCNCQYTLTITKNNSKGIMFQFDHFFSKSKYPYLSLSMYNLIPCCSNCNIAKSKTEFNLSNSIHPYHNDLSSLMEFNVSNPDALNYLINLKKTDKISVILKYKNLKVKKHIDTFSLDKIYNEHTDFVEDLFLKAYYYSPSKIKELTNEFDGLISKEAVKQFIIGNYYLDSDINKRPLSKMIKDIALQIKLID